MKNNSIVIIGSGGHSKSIIDLININGEFKIIGLVGKKNDVGKNVLGFPVIGTDKDLINIRQNVPNAVVAIGQIKTPHLRAKIFKLLESCEYDLPNIISKHAFVSKDASVGKGTTIGHQAIVNAGANIGKYCIVNTKSLIEHDSFIGDFCHLSTGVLINGNVQIEDNCFIGSGTIIREGIKLPRNTIISAGKCIMGWPVKNNLSR